MCGSTATMKNLLSANEPTTLKNALRKRMHDDIGASKLSSNKKAAFTSSYLTSLTQSLDVTMAQEVVSSTPAPTLSRKKSDAGSEDVLLEKDFQPGNWHVIYGREKSHKEHIGNKRLRVLIANNLKAYVEAPTRREKSQIIDDVASQIRCYGGFVKKTREGRWLSIGPSQSREKVGHSFRDCMKLFKGNKPSCKQTIWEEAQNAIFSNLQLRGSCSFDPSSASSVSSSSTPVQAPVQQQQQQVPPMTTLPEPVVSEVVVTPYYSHHDPLPLDDDSCGFPSLVVGATNQMNPLEWFDFTN
ncbi:Nitrilase family, member 2 [Seminavis robusta]|uniref:Nitrilase family, member 2 n=1 Tax=Seminavis robusta TaxID=568900 RepID=A0A9N8HDH5_9STRA|nr:Nitrilase family, member 2 [Seminavis robusta]|eukprot:Sro344_g122190.1 Nitrilase family, member 2 (299) ;mRNA; r:27078-28064